MKNLEQERLNEKRILDEKIKVKFKSEELARFKELQKSQSSQNVKILNEKPKNEVKKSELQKIKEVQKKVVLVKSKDKEYERDRLRQEPIKGHFEKTRLKNIEEKKNVNSLKLKNEKSDFSKVQEVQNKLKEQAKINQQAKSNERER